MKSPSRSWGPRKYGELGSILGEGVDEPSVDIETEMEFSLIPCKIKEDVNVNLSMKMNYIYITMLKII